MNLFKFRKSWVWELLLGLFVIFLFYFFGNRKLNNLKRHSKITIGYTTNIWNDTKGRPYVKYSYLVNGITYNSQKALTENDSVIIPNGKILIIYDSTKCSVSAAVFNVDLEVYDLESNLDSIFGNKTESLNMWNWQ